MSKPKRRTQSKYTMKDNDSLQDLANKIDETDEMKLKLLENQEIDNIIYPAELNIHFIEQIKVLTTENTELRKLLFERDTELSEMAKTIKCLNDRIRDLVAETCPSISSKSAAVISTKLSDLCKQNRHLVAEVESYKMKCSCLENKIQALEEINKNINTCSCNLEVVKVIEATPDELKILNDKLAAASKKLTETKNKNSELKNEILMANKILQNELGDKFISLKDMPHDLAGWKGRAQQIMILQNKISDLEEKLNIKVKDLVQERKKEQNTQVLRNLEAKRKREMEVGIKDMQKCKEENQELKRKLDGTRARIRILECEVTTLKQKVQTLFDKSNHDDLLVDEQNKQLKSIEVYYQEIVSDSTYQMNKLRDKLIESEKECENTRCKIDALQCKVAEKTNKLEELRNQILRYEESSLQNVFFSPMKTANENEIAKLSELVNTLNERLTLERKNIENMERNSIMVKESRERLKRKISKLELQNRTLKEMKLSGKSLSKASLDKHLSSVISSLKSSLVSESGTESGSKGRLNEGSQQKLEYDLCNCQYVDEENQFEKEDLRNKLELAEERLKITENRLKISEEEKADDYKTLTEMIQTSKRLYTDALAVLQQNKCVC